MTKQKWCVIFLIAAAVMIAVSFFLLPETVTVQVNAGGQVSRTMPRLLALVIPTGITLLGTLLYYFSTEAEGKKRIIAPFVGLLCYFILIFFNL